MIGPSGTNDAALGTLVEDFPISGEASNLDAQILFVLSGIHLAFLPPHYARHWAELGEVRELLPGTFSMVNTIYALTRKAASYGAAAEALLQTILKAFGEHGDIGLALQADRPISSAG